MAIFQTKLLILENHSVNKTAWTELSWGPIQERAFSLYRRNWPTQEFLVWVCWDPMQSNHEGFSQCFIFRIQHSSGCWKPVAYASRTMSKTEKLCVHIERKALATTWAYEKFSNCLLGRPSISIIEMGHNPFIPMLNSNSLKNHPLSVCVLRFRFETSRFEYESSHVTEKHMFAADTYLRLPT